MKNVTLISIMGVDPEFFEVNLIYHFFEHYRSLGIENFKIVADDNTGSKEGTKILRECGIQPVLWADKFNDETKEKKLRGLHDACETSWIFTVDSDEFVEVTNLKMLLDEMEKQKTYAASGILIDHLSLIPEKVRRDVSPWAQFPIKKPITGGLCGGEINKVFIFNKTYYEIHDGGFHHVVDRKTGEITGHRGYKCYNKIYDIAHFKWTATALKRMQKRVNEYDKSYTYIDEFYKAVEFLKNGYK